MGVNFTARFKSLQRELQAYDKKRIKAYQTAVKVEGFRLSSLLKAEIRRGAPGGRSFKPLSRLAIARRYGQMKRKPPLHRLAIPVRYRVDYATGKMAFSVGYLVEDISNPWNRNTQTGIKSKNRISKKWAYLVKLHQAGKRIPVTPDIRKALVTIGASMQKRKNTRNQSNVFFLKKSTTSINIPARPIIDPFWKAHRQKAAHNIMLNFHRKMQGERI